MTNSIFVVGILLVSPPSTAGAASKFLVPDAQFAPPPQEIQAGRKAPAKSAKDEKSDGSVKPNPRLEQARALRTQALAEFEGGEYQKAAESWHELLNKHTGLPEAQDASYYYGLCLYYLGRPKDAVAPLGQALTSTRDPIKQIDLRLILADTLLQVGKRTEALALTFEILPDKKAEERAGLRRKSGVIGSGESKVKPDSAQTIRLHTLRGRIFAALGNERLAVESLAEARKQLDIAKETELSQAVKQSLAAQWARRQLEVVAEGCYNKFPTPQRLSESEFLAYADRYYRCAEPAKQLYCTVLAAEDEQVRTQTVGTYRTLVLAPLELGTKLPPPARKVAKGRQRSLYESEMKALIKRTVDEHAKGFRNLSSCGAFDIF